MWSSCNPLKSYLQDSSEAHIVVCCNGFELISWRDWWNSCTVCGKSVLVLNDNDNDWKQSSTPRYSLTTKESDNNNLVSRTQNVKLSDKCDLLLGVLVQESVSQKRRSATCKFYAIITAHWTCVVWATCHCGLRCCMMYTIPIFTSILLLFFNCIFSF